MKTKLDGEARYTPTVSAVDEESPILTKIHYVNSIPGAGKTFAAERVAIYTLKNRETVNYMLVYVAPTHVLLHQFMDNLAEVISPKVLAKHTRIIKGDQPGTTVQQQFYGYVNGYSDSVIDIKQMKNGSIVLMTHEAFRKVPLRMQGKQRLSIIFDEARQCLQSSMSLTLPEKVLEYFRLNYIVEHEQVAKDSKLSLRRWSWVGQKFNENKILNLWGPYPKKFYRQFMHLVSELRNSSHHVWVNLVENPALEPGHEVTVHVLLSPSQLFFGYGRVLILSAFFEYSQMYHLLKRQEVSTKTRADRIELKRKIPEERIQLFNVTSQLIDEKRAQQINKVRLSKTTITYVLKDESLSKYHLNTGIVVAYTEKKNLSAMSKKYAAMFTGRVLHYKAFINKVNRSSEDTLVSVRSSAHDKLKLIKSMKPSKYSVVQYLAKASVQIQRAWLEEKGKKDEPLLMCINAKDKRGSFDSLWVQENLDKVLGSQVVEVPVINHGMNKWSKYNTAAFLATLKLSKEESKFMEILLPEYQASLDTTVDKCIQFIFRSSLRNPKSTKSTLVIVSDEQLATQVRDVLNNHMRLLPPEEIVEDWKYKSIAVARMPEDPEKRAKRQKARNIETRKKANYGEYNKLSVKISRLKKKLAVNDDPSKTSKWTKELNELVVKRKALNFSTK